VYAHAMNLDDLHALLVELDIEPLGIKDALIPLYDVKDDLKIEVQERFESIIKKTNKFVYFKDGSKEDRKAFGRQQQNIRIRMNKIANAISFIEDSIECQRRVIEETEEQERRENCTVEPEPDEMDYDDTYDPGFDEPHDDFDEHDKYSIEDYYQEVIEILKNEIKNFRGIQEPFTIT
jgi:hypothetical protein